MGSKQSKCRKKEQNCEVSLMKQQITTLENQLIQFQNIKEIEQKVKHLHEALKSRYVRMDEFVCNPGLEFIAHKIFEYVDCHETLMNCRLVSKSWKNCLDRNRKWWILQLDKIRKYKFDIGDAYEKADFCEFDPEFVEEVLFDIEKSNFSFEDLKTFVNLMKDFISNRRGTSFPCPLHYAARHGRLDFFRVLTKTHLKDFNVVIESSYDECSTPLSVACYNGQLEIIEFYLNLEGERKIDFNSTDETGLTLFHYACHSGLPENVQFVMKYSEILKLDLDIHGNDGLTPFMMACTARRKCKTVVELLLRLDCIDFNARDEYGKNVVHLICEDTFYKEHKKLWFKTQCQGSCNDPSLIELLWKHSDKIDFNAIDDSGRTPFHIACMKHCLLKVEFFFNKSLEIGLDTNHRDENGLTPFHFAVMDYEYEEFRFFHICRIRNRRCETDDGQEFFAFLQYFLQKVQNGYICGNIPDDQGRTPLHWMYLTRCRGQIGPFIKMLKNYQTGIDIKALDKNGQTPKKLGLLRDEIERERKEFNVNFMLHESE